MVGDRAAFEAAVKRANSYAWEERWMKAIEQYELATAEFPEDVSARGGLAFAYYRGERLREALREYRRLSELRPDDWAPRVKMAEILERLGRSSDSAEAWSAVADVCVQQDDLPRAMHAWQEAIRLQPRGREARWKLAEACAQSSRAADAAKEYLALARLCHEEGELDQAAKYCQRALALESGNRAARALLERLASEGHVAVAGPCLVTTMEELGPVSEAIERALSSLAEAILGGRQLIEPAETVHAEEQSTTPAEMRGLGAGALLGKAIDLHSRGLSDEALGYYEEASRRGVGLVEVVFALGHLHKGLSQYDEAVRYLRRSAQSPEYALASQLALGQCYWAQGRPSEALDHFLAALQIIDLEMVGPDQADEVRQAYEILAASGWGRGNGRGSEMPVESLLALLCGRDWKETVKAARVKRASVAEDDVLPILPEVLDIPGGDQVVEIMVRSREHLKQGLPFTALEECYRAIRLAPTYLPLHLRLAEIFAEQGKADEAVSKYSAVADAYLMRENSPKAIEVYRRALLAAPMAIAVREKLIDLLVAHGGIELALEEYVALGESCYRLARVDSALQRYEQALALTDQAEVPAEWQVRILHRVADLQMQRVHWKESAQTYEQILELSPEDEQAMFRLIELRYRLGQERLALKELDALIVQCGKSKEFGALIRMLKELVASNPQDISIRSRLSRIHIELGMISEAVAELDTLGELQLEAGRKKEAIETLRTIIALEPAQKESYTQLLSELERSVGRG